MSGVIPDSDYGNLAQPTNRWNKPVLTTIWYNSHQDRWDGIIPTGDPNGTSGSDHWLCKDFPGAADYHLLVSARTFSRCDIVWNDGTKTLYVVEGHNVTPRVHRIDYDDITDTYSIDATVNLDGDLRYTTGDNDSQPLAIYQTPNGDLWVSIQKVSRFRVERSVNGGDTWTTLDLSKPSNLNVVGVVAFGHFTDSGTTYLLLVGMENDGNRAFAWRHDQDAAHTAGNWSDESSNLPAIPDAGADDHLCVRSHDNHVYVATKSEVSSDVSSLILWEREPGGTWTDYVLESGGDDNGGRTRPSIAIDTTTSDLYQFYGAFNVARDLRYKVAPLASLGDITTTSEQTLLAEGGGVRWDQGCLTSREPVTSTSGLVVAAAEHAGADIYWAEVDLAPSGIPIGRAVETEIVNQITPLTPRLVDVGRATEVELARFISPVKHIFVPVQTVVERELARMVTPQAGAAFIPRVVCETVLLPVTCEIVDAFGQGH